MWGCRFKTAFVQVGGVQLAGVNEYWGAVALTKYKENVQSLKVHSFNSMERAFGSTNAAVIKNLLLKIKKGVVWIDAVPCISYNYWTMRHFRTAMKYQTSFTTINLNQPIVFNKQMSNNSYSFISPIKLFERKLKN